MLLNDFNDFTVLVHFDGHKFLFLKKKVFKKNPLNKPLTLKEMVCFGNTQEETIDQFPASFNPLQNGIPNMDL